MLTSAEVRKKLSDSTELPTLPAAAMHILQLTQNENVEVADMAEVIANDPALSLKVLRAVNSPFYGLSQEITSVSQAVALLGVQAVRTLVLGFSLVSLMRSQKSNGLNHMKYWRRSMFAATSARVLAEHVLPYRIEECFVAALLMDIGMLVLDQLFGEQYDQVVDRAHSHPEVLMIESHYLGITHPEVAGVLSEQWQLPEQLRLVLSSHHKPMEVEDHINKKITQVIWLAGRCADIFSDVDDKAESISAVRRSCRELYQLDEIVCDGMLCKVGMKTRDLASIFEISMNPESDYNKILADANHRLLELTLGAEQAKNGVKERRRAVRIRRDSKLILTPCNKGILLKPRQVRVRDISVAGIGVSDTHPMEVGSQFIVQLPQKDGQTTTLLYNVRRCVPIEKLFDIGGELSSVLRPSPAKTAAGN
jgi:two-component system cell cycle response regulator